MVVFSHKLTDPISNSTSMACHKILFVFFLVSFLNFTTTEAQSDLTYEFHFCSNNETTSNSASLFNLIKTLLSVLASNATGDTQFYNSTITGKNPSQSVYGLFLCRGDILSQLCQQCVLIATQRLSSECSLSKQALIWYQECIVRYSDRPFFSTVATTPSSCLSDMAIASNPQSFTRLIFMTMNQTADEAAPHPIGSKKYATKQVSLSRFQTLYFLAQCTHDLSPHDCRTCLDGAIGELPSCSEGRLGGAVLYPSCLVAYASYPFYRTFIPSLTLTQAIVPQTSISAADSKFSQDPFYLSHNCSSNTTYIDNHSFRTRLKTLLFYLSSNASKSGKHFHKANVGNMAYGLFMCRGDLPPFLCGQCVLNATHRILLECRSFQEAIIWYSHCLLRYSYEDFFSVMDTSPMFSMLNITNTSSTNQEQNYFTFILANALFKLVLGAGDSDERYLTKSIKLNAFQTLYILGQCTEDLSDDDCSACLANMIDSEIPWTRLGSIGGRILYPSCNIRFELFQFYRVGDEAEPPRPGSPTGEEIKKGLSHTIILIVVPVIVSVILFSFAFYLLKKTTRKRSMTALRENFGHESASLEPMQFSLAIIETATGNFSEINKIGKGGFGEVYKGILLDGQQIAVKRLSKNSRQGADEFKNEVSLIAKLQHRNLVTFIGFCLEKQEKILTYEYVPNRSLDYFVFDSQRQKVLSWSERYIIIGGIAKGIVYLHEHSRLKVIHRDLKPSNVLLDENMIPKISDFGLARIVEINQDQGSTNRIVGTFGYMSPEYTMLGRFSEKSDVFSFGVMILEIISGKKNIGSHEPQRVMGGLLSYVWRQWKNQTLLSILDPNIKENYSEIEVIKCIQIGLLCVQQNPDIRPTMVAAVSYLSTHSTELLPTPQEPAFFLEGRMNPKAIAHESSSSQSINNSTPCSNNEMSMSTFLPR